MRIIGIVVRYVISGLAFALAFAPSSARSAGTAPDVSGFPNGYLLATMPYSIMLVDPATGFHRQIMENPTGISFGSIVYNPVTRSAFITPYFSGDAIYELQWRGGTQYELTTFTALLDSPRGLAVDREGSLYTYSSQPTPGIYKITLEGTVTRVTTSAMSFIGISTYLALSPDESKLYVSLESRDRIDAVSITDGTISTFRADVSSPTGLDVAPDGTVYFVENESIGVGRQIWAIPADGATTAVIKKPWMSSAMDGLIYDALTSSIVVGARYKGLHAIAANGNDRLLTEHTLYSLALIRSEKQAGRSVSGFPGGYVLATTSHNIMLIDPVTAFHGTLIPPDWQPAMTNIAFNPITNAALFTVGLNNGRVYELRGKSGGGYEITTVTKAIESPQGIAVDRNGDAYIGSATVNPRIWKLSRAGVVSLVSRPANYNLFVPKYMALSPDESKLYVTASPMNQVDVVALPSGTVSLFADDVDWPGGIAVAADGTVYFAENTFQETKIYAAKSVGAPSIYLKQPWMTQAVEGMVIDRIGGSMFVSDGALHEINTNKNHRVAYDEIPDFYLEAIDLIPPQPEPPTAVWQDWMRYE